MVTPVVTGARRADGLGTALATLAVTPATTGADIEWTVLTGPPVDAFRVDATPTGATVAERSAACNAGARRIALRGLRSGATYVVTVSALSGGSVVDRATATVRAGPSLATVHADAIVGGLRVSWLTRPGAAVHGFRVSAREPKAARAARTVDTEAATTEVVVRGLRPGARYTVSVHALFADEPTDGLSITASAARGAPYWRGWDIARGVALAPAGGGYTLDAWGAVHPWADTEHVAPPSPGRLRYWRGRDVTRGLALVPSGRGGLILDGHGHLYPFGIGGDRAPTVRGAAIAASDAFRAVVVLPDGSGGYTLDGSGALHPFAIGTAMLPPAARPTTARPSGPDWARGLAIAPDGRGGLVLDAFGHAFPFSIGSGRAPRPPSRAPLWTFPIVRAASLPAAPGTGVVLDGWGGVHPLRVVG